MDGEISLKVLPVDDELIQRFIKIFLSGKIPVDPRQTQDPTRLYEIFFGEGSRETDAEFISETIIADNYFLFQRCVERSSEYLAMGRVVPANLAIFLIEVLNSRLKTPRKVDRMYPLERDFNLAEAVRIVIKNFDIRPTRNDESCSTTACDYVSRVSSQLGEPASYSVVKKAWIAYRHDFEFDLREPFDSIDKAIREECGISI